jgi:hypothetical protein
MGSIDYRSALGSLRMREMNGRTALIFFTVLRFGLSPAVAIEPGAYEGVADGGALSASVDGDRLTIFLGGPGCGGSGDGTITRAAEGRWTAHISLPGLPVCTLQLDKEDGGFRIQENGCASYHGASCSFDGFISPAATAAGQEQRDQELGGADSTTQVVVDGTGEAIEGELMRMAIAAIQSDLVDPASLQLRNLREREPDVLCGEYNSKNRMGGYGGFSEFLYIKGSAKAGLTDPLFTMPTTGTDPAIFAAIHEGAVLLALERAGCILPGEASYVNEMIDLLLRE